MLTAHPHRYRIRLGPLGPPSHELLFNANPRLYDYEGALTSLNPTRPSPARQATPSVSDEGLRPVNGSSVSTPPADQTLLPRNFYHKTRSFSHNRRTT